MLDSFTPLNTMPSDFQINWMSQLHKAPKEDPLTSKSVFRLIHAERTDGRSSLGQRVTVLVVNSHNVPLALVPVAFSYSTADQYLLSENFVWTPPQPQKAFITKTGGSGQVDMVQGSVVKSGEPGGMTVYVMEPEYPSDVVTGCGMLSNHDGMFLVFKLFNE